MSVDSLREKQLAEEPGLPGISVEDAAVNDETARIGARAIRAVDATAHILLDEGLERLRKGSWYPVGLAPSQVNVEEPFFKTKDVLLLVRALMERSVPGGDVHLIVANPFTNILDNLRRRASKAGVVPSEEMLLEQAQEQARLIGIKDILLYEAVQDLLLKEEPGGTLTRVPVILMSDIEAHSDFEVLRGRVQSLFDENPEFAEEVYSCVPASQRPLEPHRTKSLAELERMENKRWIKEARSRASYVLAQISHVLFIGGNKLGHQGENLYNAVTECAASLLGIAIQDINLGFTELTVDGVTGINPYRVRKGAEKVMKADSLTRYQSMKAYLQAHAPAAEASLKEFERLSKEQRDLIAMLLDYLSNDSGDPHELISRFKISVMYMDVGLRRFERDVLQAQAKECEKLETNALRFSSLIQNIDRRIAACALLKLDEKTLVRTSYEDQWCRERILDTAQFPRHLARFLLKRSGLLSVATGAMPVADLQFEISKWLPLCHVGIYGSAEHEICQETASYLFTGEGPLWQVTLPLYERAIFSEESYGHREGKSEMSFEDVQRMLSKPGIVDGKELLDFFDDFVKRQNTVYNRLFKILEQARWEALDELLTALEGTPFERIHRKWLDLLQGRPTEDIPWTVADLLGRAPMMEQMMKTLRTPIFQKSFRAFFFREIARITDVLKSQ